MCKARRHKSSFYSVPWLRAVCHHVGSDRSGAYIIQITLSHSPILQHNQVSEREKCCINYMFALALPYQLTGAYVWHQWSTKGQNVTTVRRHVVIYCRGLLSLQTKTTKTGTGELSWCHYKTKGMKSLWRWFPNKKKWHFKSEVTELNVIYYFDVLFCIFSGSTY